MNCSDPTLETLAREGLRLSRAADRRDRFGAIAIYKGILRALDPKVPKAWLTPQYAGEDLRRAMRPVWERYKRVDAVCREAERTQSVHDQASVQTVAWVLWALHWKYPAAMEQAGNWEEEAR